MSAVKCLVSLFTFCLGVVNTMKTDKLFQSRGVGTSTVGNVKDLILTLFLSFFPLAGLVFHIGCLIMISTIAVFSWSWTEETAEPHHLCFLAPFLPFILAALIQLALFQKYVKPISARDQRFAFLSLIIPVRIFLVKNKERAFKYYTLSVTNVWGSVLLSFLILIAAIFNLPEKEDTDRQLLLMAVEVVLPQLLWEIHLMLFASMLLWYFVISPSLETDHFCPDYQNLQDRMATFPFYWSYTFCNLLLRERLYIEKLELNHDPELSQWTDLLCAMQNRDIQDSEADNSEISGRSLPMEGNSKEHINLAVLSQIDESTKVRADLVNRIMLDILDKATAHHFSASGFFYSHPRMTGLQVLQSSKVVMNSLAKPPPGNLLQLWPCSG